ncbi:MAG: hypothetical protein JO232_19600 [Verrucomicrobia bacterium]|nr:hypothetical protein [Verrucomicrobiota bacterium]
MTSKQIFRWSNQRAVVVALMWALIPSVAALVLAPLIPDPELRKLVNAGAVTLFFGGFLGGMLKVLIDEVVAAKQRREDAALFVAKTLEDLKSVYDQVARARIVIPAHKSVKTYGDELRGMIEARVKLRNIIRALERPAAGVDDQVQKNVRCKVDRMEKYLETFTKEFCDRFKSLSDEQRGYEERAKVLLKRFAETEPPADTETPPDPPELPPFVWKSISQLEKLSDFIGERDTYKNEFERPLDDASESLREEHARILGIHRRVAEQ